MSPRVSQTLLGLQVLSSTEAEGRVMEGIITGIGFIGGAPGGGRMAHVPDAHGFKAEL